MLILFRREALLVVQDPVEPLPSGLTGSVVIYIRTDVGLGIGVLISRVMLEPLTRAGVFVNTGEKMGMFGIVEAGHGSVYRILIVGITTAGRG